MKTLLSLKTFFLLIAFSVFFSKTAEAHAPDQSYIFLKVYEDRMEALIQMEVKDINSALGTQLQEGLSLEDAKSIQEQLLAYIKQRTRFSTDDTKYELELKNVDVLVLQLGSFIDMTFNIKGTENNIPDKLDVHYSGIFDKVPNHQGMLVIAYNWKAGIFNNESLVSLIFTPSDTDQSLDLTDASVMKGFLTMIWMGVWHIFIGTDHILFILALVLPAVVYRLNKKKEVEPYYEPVNLPYLGSFNSWGPVEKFRPAILYVLMIITFFTISHCITLSLAALEIINLPSRFVESIIAVSIGLAAIHNIRPLFKKDWVIAFGFGLFHGFGFASVLGDIGLSGEYMVLSLLGFNLGVELGQVAIICAIFPVLYFLRKSRKYAKILVYGSLLLVVISLYWFVERAFDVDFLLDNYISIAINKFFGLFGFG